MGLVHGFTREEPTLDAHGKDNSFVQTKSNIRNQSACVKINELGSPSLAFIEFIQPSLGKCRRMFSYSTVETSTQLLVSAFETDLPVLPEVRAKGLDWVDIISDSAEPLIPIVFKAHESFAALKALEGIIAVALCKERFGENENVKAIVNCNHAGLFPAMSFLSTVDELYKWDPGMKKKIKGVYLFRVVYVKRIEEST